MDLTFLNIMISVLSAIASMNLALFFFKELENHVFKAFFIYFVILFVGLMFSILLMVYSNASSLQYLMTGFRAVFLFALIQLNYQLVVKNGK